jgi:hypothetical protein
MTDMTTKFKIGTSVVANDGAFGHIHHVILSPLQHHIVGVVVRAHLIPPRDWVVPTELIADVTDAWITLTASREDILKQPMFDPSHYLSIMSEKWGYCLGEAIVKRIADLASVFKELESRYE